jgi:hypothetical protein
MEEHKEQKEHKDGIREGETKLDYHIRTTKNNLKLDKLFPRPSRPPEQYHYYEEFGFGFTRGPMIRRAIWLLSKLSVLYLVKGFKRLAQSCKQA